MKRIQIGILTGVALLALTAGCGKNTGSDDALSNDIKAKLYADPNTKQASINVAVKDGVATLSGDVPSADTELAAMKIANGTSGVHSVNDQLKVNGTPVSQLPNAGDNTAPPASPYNNGQPNRAPAPSATASAPPAHVAPEATRVRTFSVPAGERVSVRMIDSIDSRTNSAGQTFRASLNAPLTEGDRVVVPAGAPATVVLESGQSAGRVKGSSELTVRLASIEAHGKTYDVRTTDVTEQGKAKGKQTAIRTGIGAAAGALIGGLAGGGKGAAIGAGAGGGAGLGYQFFTHGAQVKIPSETVLTFRLEAPLSIER